MQIKSATRSHPTASQLGKEASDKTEAGGARGSRRLAEAPSLKLAWRGARRRQDEDGEGEGEEEEAEEEEKAEEEACQQNFVPWARRACAWRSSCYLRAARQGRLVPAWPAASVVSATSAGGGGHKGGRGGKRGPSDEESSVKALASCCPSLARRARVPPRPDWPRPARPGLVPRRAAARRPAAARRCRLQPAPLLPGP
ncbi:unnamed protein product, partial [Prorocentrum cordatum]